MGGPRGARALTVAVALLGSGVVCASIMSPPLVGTTPAPRTEASSLALASASTGTLAGATGQVFGVTVGPAATLYPGVAVKVPVTYRNPFTFPIAVTTYRETVSLTRAVAGCGAQQLVVPVGTVTLTRPLRIASGASLATTVPAKLSGKAPAACQRATFRITLTASAVKA